MAHAAVNAALAAAQGSNALVGAAGAATAEMAGMIALEVYGKSATELSETEKQTVSALATLATGLASGLTGGSSADAVVGAQAGKTTVENNALGGLEGFGSGFWNNVQAQDSLANNTNITDENGKVLNPATPAEIRYASDKLITGELPEGANITKAIIEGYQEGVMIAGAWYLGPATSVGKAAGGGVIAEIANGSYQWFDLSQPGNENKSWDWKSSASAGIAGMLAPGRTIGQNVGIAAGGAVFTDGPNAGAIGASAVGAWAGGMFGEYAPGIVNSVTGKELPGFIYDIGGAFASEASTDAGKSIIKKQGGEKG